MRNLKLIPIWAWVSLAVVVVGLALWSNGSDNGKCNGCDCDAGCCDGLADSHQQRRTGRIPDSRPGWHPGLHGVCPQCRDGLQPTGRPTD